MKNKRFLFLSALMASCILAFACNQSKADTRRPDFPTSNSYKCPGAVGDDQRYDGQSRYNNNGTTSDQRGRFGGRTGRRYQDNNTNSDQNGNNWGWFGGQSAEDQDETNGTQMRRPFRQGRNGNNGDNGSTFGQRMFRDKNNGMDSERRQELRRQFRDRMENNGNDENGWFGQRFFGGDGNGQYDGERGERYQQLRRQFRDRTENNGNDENGWFGQRFFGDDANGQYDDENGESMKWRRPLRQDRYMDDSDNGNGWSNGGATPYGRGRMFRDQRYYGSPQDEENSWFGTNQETSYNYGSGYNNPHRGCRGRYDGGSMGCPTPPGAQRPCGTCPIPGGKCPGGYNWQRNPREEDQWEERAYSQPKGYDNRYRGYAQRMYGSSKLKNNPHPSRPLKGGTMETFKGTVRSMNQVTYPGENQIHMILSTNGEEFTVVLGPAWYVNQARVKFQSGDKVQVIGSRIQANGDEVIIASEVSKNGNSLQLRDQSGNPTWGSQPQQRYQSPRGSWYSRGRTQMDSYFN